jgi:hypothetical protein
MSPPVPASCREANRERPAYFFFEPRTATPCVVTPPVMAWRSVALLSSHAMDGCLDSKCAWGGRLSGRGRWVGGG